MDPSAQRVPTQADIDEESRRLRRLRIVVRITLDLIMQGNLSYEEALEVMAATRRVALQMFPDKSETYDLIYQPKLERALRETYRLN